jgi:hypothetical protein
MNVSDPLVQRYRELRCEAEGAVLLMQAHPFSGPVRRETSLD